MHADFWHKKWEAREIGFHQPKENSFLVQFLGALGAFEGGTIFVPLCGKTLDIHWLLAQGYKVTGAELSEPAIIELFEELGVKPSIKQVGPLKTYTADDICIYVGDIFDLTPQQLGHVDAVYDRAALVALPEAMRVEYAQHVVTLTNRAPQLVITFEYDQSALAGPPFSITPEHLATLYGKTYKLADVASRAVKRGLKDIAAQEKAWVLLPV